MLTTCPGLHSIAERPGFELATYSDRKSSVLTTRPPRLQVVAASRTACLFTRREAFLLAMVTVDVDNIKLDNDVMTIR